MAVVVTKLRATAIGNIPVTGIPQIYFNNGFRTAGGVFLGEAKVFRTTTTGGAVPFESSNSNRIDTDSLSVITAGTVTMFDVYDIVQSSGDAPAADYVWFDSYSTAVNLFKLEFLDASNVVVGTYNAATTNPDHVKLALGTPATPPFWTAFDGAYEAP